MYFPEPVSSFTIKQEKGHLKPKGLHNCDFNITTRHKFKSEAIKKHLIGQLFDMDLFK